MSSQDLFSFLPGGGVTGSLARSINWASHPLGPPNQWPQSLKTALGILFHSRHPMFLFWGPELICFYNDAYLPSFGEGKHPLAMGQRGADLWGEIWPIIYPQIENVMERGVASWNVDHLVPIYRNGTIEEVYWTYSYSPVYDESGTVGGTFVTCTETTSRVLSDRRSRALHALTERTARTQSGKEIIESATASMRENPHDLPFALVYLFDPRKDRVAVLTEVVGFDSDVRMLAGRGVFRAEDSLLELLDQAIYDRSPKYVAKAADVLPRLPHASWSSVHNAAAIVPISLDLAERRPAGFMVLGLSLQLPFDQGYREFVEQLASRIGVALRINHAYIEAESARCKLQEVFMEAPVAIAVLSGPDHVFELANEGYRQLIGGDRDILGKPVREALPEIADQGYFELLDQVYRTGEPFLGAEREVTFRLPDQSEKKAVVDFIYQPSRALGGEVDGIIAVVINVSEQVEARSRIEKLAQDLQAAVSARDTFVAIASHELKTPLSSLMLQAQMNRRIFQREGMDGFKPERLQKFLENSIVQVERLSRLVDDMLDISRISLGRLALNRELVDMSRLTSEIFDQFRPQFAANGAELMLELETGVKAEVDVHRIEQVATNLITNALRYAPGAPLHVKLRKRQEWVELSVEDEGPGIPAEAHERIFERFERAADSASVTGFGLGLHISKEIIEAHRGQISVRSQPGKGSCFTVRLPL